jgi:hypothetical protein
MSGSEQSPTRSGGPETTSNYKTPKNALTVLFGREDACSTDGADPLSFPCWLPPAVMRAAKRIHAQLATEKDPAKAREVLSRLTCDERMRPIWWRPYEKSRDTGELLYPAHIRYTSKIPEYRRRARELRSKGGRANEQEARSWEAEAAELEGKYDPLDDQPWTDQDLAAQLFLWHVYRSALNRDPVFLSKLKAKARKLDSVAMQLRKIAAALQLLGKDKDARAQKDMAHGYADEARNLDSVGPDDDPWIIRHQKIGDDELRALVGLLSTIPVVLFGKKWLGTIATIANVVLNRQDLKALKIRDVIEPSRKKREENVTGAGAQGSEPA